uniref:Uncharacterized protein n=1 Tax=Nelumbo nucifera TaxID=4432 RepID=A0A822Z8W6_NELNU|nr:TPA_asm: hypothetical protein HUJ06_001005 [Nelumbo nucifera]
MLPPNPGDEAILPQSTHRNRHPSPDAAISEVQKPPVWRQK